MNNQNIYHGDMKIRLNFFGMIHNSTHTTTETHFLQLTAPFCNRYAYIIIISVWYHQPAISSCKQCLIRYEAPFQQPFSPSSLGNEKKSKIIVADELKTSILSIKIVSGMIKNSTNKCIIIFVMFITPQLS